MKVVGHRGAKGLALENTIASIEAGLRSAVDEIEFDARVTQDGIVVLNHDPDLKRVLASDLVIAKSTYTELKAIHPKLTTLEEGIKAVNRTVPIMLEIKPKVPTAPIIEIVGRFIKDGWQPDDFIIVSFSQKALLDIKRALPELKLGVNEKFSGVRATWRARKLGARRLGMNHRWLWSGFIKLVSRKYDLYAYPLNNVKRARRFERYGLRGVITDYPDRFKKP